MAESLKEAISSLLAGAREVVYLTAGEQTLTAWSGGNIFANSGATEDVVFVLPSLGAAIEGIGYTFVVTSTLHDLFVRPAAIDQFRGMYCTDLGGKKLKGDRVDGSILNVLCVKDDSGQYRWYTTGLGTWSESD